MQINFISLVGTKILGCYRLPPLKEISSPRFEEARRKDGFRLPWWATTLKRNFCG
jgi:hypothetical protein